MKSYKSILISFIMMLSLITSPTAVLADNSDSDRLFDWAEQIYADLFSPAGQSSATYEQYYYRYYPDTNTYLGTSNSQVFYFEPDVNPSIQMVGVISDYITTSDNGTAETVGTTKGVLCNYNDTTLNSQSSVTYTSTSKWTCTDTARELTANGIPDHEVGTFPNPGNPNTITEQTVSASYTLEPIETTTATQLGGPRGTIAHVLNGIKVDAGTGGTCDDSGDSCSLGGNVGSWNIEALGQTSFDFGTDDNNAHVQPGGVYHYHGMPEGFIKKRGGNSSTMTLIGWAADGFPIYARYGYSTANDASSALKVMMGSYQLITDVSANRPPVDIYPLGTFSQDWEYVEGSGDLDECNGRVGVTPEFPNGTYHYYATDSYPYFQRCVKGTVETGNAGGPPLGGGQPPQ